MQLLIKAALILIIIFLATGMAKKFLSLAGLIAVMPLTGALALVWVYVENRGNPRTVCKPLRKEHSGKGIRNIQKIIKCYRTG